MADYQFRIVPLGLEGMRSHVEQDKLDFVLTNTGNYVVLEDAFGISRLATLKVRHLGQDFTQFGAVIFTRRDHPKLNRIEDLADHTMMAVSRNAFGGFQMRLASTCCRWIWAMASPPTRLGCCTSLAANCFLRGPTTHAFW